MHFRDITGDEMIGKTRRKDRLVVLLRQALANRQFFTHWEYIEGLPYSGRVLLTERRPAATAFAQPTDAAEAAVEMFKTCVASLYSPHFRINASRGWQVRTCTIDGAPAAILLAEWISYGQDQ